MVCTNGSRRGRFIEAYLACDGGMGPGVMRLSVGRMGGVHGTVRCVLTAYSVTRRVCRLGLSNDGLVGEVLLREAKAVFGHLKVQMGIEQEVRQVW